MRYGRIAAVIGLIGVVLAVEWVWIFSREPSDVAPQGATDTMPAKPPGGPFSLVDHEGNPATSESFRGEYVIMVFGYTFCPDVCPMTLHRVVEALDILGSDGGVIRPVFVSVDTRRDTPSVLADYVSAIDPRLIGLTGGPEQIADAARQFRVYYSVPEADEADYLVDHSAYIYLLGPNGETLSYFKHDISATDLAAGIRGAKARANLADSSTLRP
jgi:cytochrome oxidase Cu insertion factor (SCO1/SenC/PrrC family)